MSEPGDEPQALKDLRWHWEGAYRISISGNWWIAIRVDDGTEIMTADPVALQEELVADYARKPVPRGADE